MDPAQEVHYTDGEHEALVTRVGDLRDLELAGTVTAETLIWAEGSAISDWTPFAQCRETLFGKSRVSAFAAHLDAAGEDEVAPANAENASVLAGLSKLKEGGALLSKLSGANDDGIYAAIITNTRRRRFLRTVMKAKGIQLLGHFLRDHFFEYFLLLEKESCDQLDHVLD